MHFLASRGGGNRRVNTGNGSDEDSLGPLDECLERFIRDWPFLDHFSRTALKALPGVEVRTEHEHGKQSSDETNSNSHSVPPFRESVVRIEARGCPTY